MCKAKCRINKKHVKPNHEVRFVSQSYNSFGDLLMLFTVNGQERLLTYPEGQWVSKYTAKAMLEEFG